MNCTYCGEDQARYETVVVERETVAGDGAGEDDEGADALGDTERAGVFCNYGCLSAWLAETDAATGACCRID